MDTSCTSQIRVGTMEVGRLLALEIIPGFVFLNCLEDIPFVTKIFQAAVSILKQELNEELIELANAQDLAVKVLSKTLDMTKLTSEKGEFCEFNFFKN